MSSFDPLVEAATQRLDHEMNWDYIAGFFDGEGNATLRIKRIHNGVGFPYRVSPEITIAQKERTVLDCIKDFLGYGGVYKLTGERHVLMICNKPRCKHFLQNIIAKLWVKREHAKIMLNFCELPNNRRYESFHDLWDKQLALVDDIRALTTTFHNYTIKTDEIREVLNSWKEEGKPRPRALSEEERRKLSESAKKRKRDGRGRFLKK